ASIAGVRGCPAPMLPRIGLAGSACWLKCPERGVLELENGNFRPDEDLFSSHCQIPPGLHENFCIEPVPVPPVPVTSDTWYGTARPKAGPPLPGISRPVTGSAWHTLLETVQTICRISFSSARREVRRLLPARPRARKGPSPLPRLRRLALQRLQWCLAFLRQ